MALKAGRVGVAQDQVDPYGNLKSAEHYVLPVASKDTLGGVKVGNGLSIEEGVLSSDNPTPYKLPTASDDTLGGVKVGTGLSIENGVLSLASSGGGGVYYKDYPLNAVVETSTGSGIYKAHTTADVLIPGYFPISVIILDGYTGYDNSFLGCGLYHWGSWTESGNNKSETLAYGIFNSGAGSGGWTARVYYVKTTDSHALS